MNADSNMAPDNAMWNPPIKLPYLIHFSGKVQLDVRLWPNEASGGEGDGLPLLLLLSFVTGFL